MCVRDHRETMRAALDLTHLEIGYARVDAAELERSMSPRGRRHVRGWLDKARRRTNKREMKDMKGTFDVAELHPKVFLRFAGDFCQIAGCLGRNDRFDVAIADFAHAYADQVERDHRALADAVRTGRLPVEHRTR